MSSRRRPYLNLKRSVLDLFRTPAHWLKEFAGKWSVFEKPYLDDDYRGMQFKWPSPDWPSGPGLGIGPSGPWPDRSGLWIFRWEPGICWLGVVNADCGEKFNLSVSVGLTPLASPGTGINFAVKSSEPIKVRILEIGDSGHNAAYGEPGQFSTSIKGEIADNWSGVATICVQASLAGGSLLTEFAVENPFSGGSGVLGWEKALGLPKVWEKETSTWEWDCGCVEVEVTCCDDTGMVWDDDFSPDTIAREDYVSVAVKGAIAGGPYTWSVSGTGFWFDAEYSVTSETTLGGSNILYADATACGTATITVTGCDGNVVTGYVRCTTGSWQNLTYLCGHDYGNQKYFNCIVDEGNYRYTDELACTNCVAGECEGAYTPGSDCDQTVDCSAGCSSAYCAGDCYKVLSRHRQEWLCSP